MAHDSFEDFLDAVDEREPDPACVIVAPTAVLASGWDDENDMTLLDPRP